MQSNRKLTLWTELQHDRFLESVRTCGKDYLAISTKMGNMTRAQVTSHAQRFIHSNARKTQREQESMRILNFVKRKAKSVKKKMVIKKITTVKIKQQQKIKRSKSVIVKVLKNDQINYKNDHIDYDQFCAALFLYGKNYIEIQKHIENQQTIEQLQNYAHELKTKLLEKTHNEQDKKILQILVKKKSNKLQLETTSSSSSSYSSSSHSQSSIKLVKSYPKKLPITLTLNTSQLSSDEYNKQFELENPPKSISIEPQQQLQDEIPEIPIINPPQIEPVQPEQLQAHSNIIKQNIIDTKCAKQQQNMLKTRSKSEKIDVYKEQREIIQLLKPLKNIQQSIDYNLITKAIVNAAIEKHINIQQVKLQIDNIINIQNIQQNKKSSQTESEKEKLKQSQISYDQIKCDGYEDRSVQQYNSQTQVIYTKSQSRKQQISIVINNQKNSLQKCLQNMILQTQDCDQAQNPFKQEPGQQTQNQLQQKLLVMKSKMKAIKARKTIQKTNDLQRPFVKKRNEKQKNYYQRMKEDPQEWQKFKEKRKRAYIQKQAQLKNDPQLKQKRSESAKKQLKKLIKNQ